MQEFIIERIGFRQYRCTNNSVKPIFAAVSSNVENSIINCLGDNYLGSSQFLGEKTKLNMDMYKRIQVQYSEGKYYLIDNDNQSKERVQVNMGDYIVLDTKCNLYIGRLRFTEKVARKVITMKY